VTYLFAFFGFVKGCVLFFIFPKILCGIHKEYLHNSLEHRDTRNMRFENKVLRRISYLRGWRESEIDGMCSAHGRDDKYLQNFSRRTGTEETTGEAHVGIKT
jgi:hypothetical protein